jgi:diguanylate cyclase (GGDEF)-like protein
MSIYARLRVLLALLVLVIGASVWLIAGEQRQAILGTQSQLRSANDLLTAMLDQETGLRGYQLTGARDFLEPYNNGIDEFEGARRRAVRGAKGDRTAVGQIRALTATAREWQAHARIAVGQVGHTGPRSASLADARERKALMDHLRTQDAALRRHLEGRTEAELVRARWIVFTFVLLFGGGILALGMVVVERQARLDRERALKRREYVEALQGADDELEAKELLRRRAERVVAAAEAVVLTRNASGNSLDASTDPSAVDGLAEALTHATPRSCLAIRRGRTYEREPGGEPLQSCELCGKASGASLCVPSLVGGEVIGSLLVLKPRAFKPGEREGVAGSVSQAAPVLANLRNLAIAEHRAATDPLTRLPNARSVQETLIRMVAQSQRTHSPLSAIVIDLDHFKALNDRHGHQAGDEVLESVGVTLRTTVRASDFAGRWGGEEFVVLLPDTDHEGALQAAETLRARLDGLAVPGVIAHLTASLGVATLPDDAADGPALIRAADRALYVAKADGRNCVRAAVAEPVAVES